MTGYVVKLGLAAVAIFLLGILGIVVFGGIWTRVGVGAAMVIVGGGLLLLAWNADRKERVRRAGIDELPRI